MSLKTDLLSPVNSAKAYTLFGANVFLRRLSVNELYLHEQALKEADSDNMKASIAGAKLILSAITNENGDPVPSSDLPSPEELLSIHDTVSFIDALNTVQKHSYGTVEEAQKN
ncbi:phage tail protein [Photorhabdus laumondii subsp. laumondii]|uniref:Phage tail protein n=1 Tax=Photorhabdus laumondii subsp. laumondii TaxID=141679 RepID=A0A6L9JGK5_PHOLM|nr:MULTISPECIES: phage tail protein [Photorhabdus]AXG42250.1 phage tail protein [Photorhabdus laumondii subsp. laumondii]MCC8384070.1 phage tail protein [Photorhabdus laumondii]MCC8389275.1 phage tail protein [Photorhabdus laumondii]MCC8412876.1 phage tail protein [Photorhabdus laumondii]MCZ1250568.1 phage tail protein [Photorhabdus laumondii subsp. laumondii]